MFCKHAKGKCQFINTNTIFKLLIFAGLVCSGICFAEQSLITKYWFAVNQGLDVSVLESDMQSYCWPASSEEPRDILEKRISEKLDVILKSKPPKNIINKNSNSKAKPDTDWPSMGGGVHHKGFTNEPGPTTGVEVWRRPVGWDYKPQPIIRDGKVYVATAALDTSMLCFDIQTGKKIWSARNPRIGTGRQIRALDAFELSEKEIAVIKGTFSGWISGFNVISRKNGEVLRQVPAIPQEKRFAEQEKNPHPRQLIACRTEKGKSLFVKSLLSGRTWWKFPTGFQTAEPLMTPDMVYATGLDGTLWAFNLFKNQRIAWIYKINSSWSEKPTVQNGIIYAGANDGSIYALNSHTGKLKWSSHVSKTNSRSRKLFSSAVIHNERLYIGSADDHLYCLNINNGNIVWKYDCQDWIRSKPYVNAQTVCLATLDGKIIALKNEQDHVRLLWTAQYDHYPIYSNLSGNTNSLVVCNSNYDIIVYDLKNGQQKWQQSAIDYIRDGKRKIYADSMPTITQSPVIVSGGKVIYSGKDHFVNAIDALTGKIVWRFETHGKVAAGATAKDGLVFIGQYGGDHKFYALDEKTGKPIWTKSNMSVWASPQCQDEQLFVGDTDGKLYCMNPENGDMIWQRKFGGGIYPAPALDEKRVYTGSWDGHYYCLDKNNGQIIWAFSRPGIPYHVGGRPDSPTPVLVNNMVIVPILGGRMVALNKENGKIIWQWYSPKPWRICNVTAATDGEIVIASIFGNAYECPFGLGLFGLDLKTGKELWQIPDCGGLTSPVITADGNFFVGSMGSPFVKGYKISNSENQNPKLLWQLRTGGVMYESLPAVSGNMGFFLPNDGYIYAVK